MRGGNGETGGRPGGIVQCVRALAAHTWELNLSLEHPGKKSHVFVTLVPGAGQKWGRGISGVSWLLAFLDSLVRDLASKSCSPTLSTCHDCLFYEAPSSPNSHENEGLTSSLQGPILLLTAWCCNCLKSMGTKRFTSTSRVSWLPTTAAKAVMLITLPMKLFWRLVCVSFFSTEPLTSFIIRNNS